MHFLLPILKGLVDHSERPLFKEYVGLTGPSSTPSWRTITYGAFSRDMEASAQHHQTHLRNIGVQQGKIVGIWITGWHYNDVVNLYALSRAGFIPQVFNLAMATQGGSMINELLAFQSGKALFYDHHYQEHIEKIAVPAFAIPTVSNLETSTAYGHLEDIPVVAGDDVAFIFHTSGTTSGRPKPVPQTHKWFIYQSSTSWRAAWQSDQDTQKCFNNIGSFANVAAATAINKVVPLGDCIIRTPKPDFDANEFLAMANKGLNNMLLFANRLSRLLQVARVNDEVLKALRNMQQISYTGEALNPDDVHWVIEQGLPVVAIYASTEIAICLVSNLGKPEDLPSMRLIEGSSIQLIPVLDNSSNNRGNLCDVFVPADAPNCPHHSIRNRPNGHVTGDLFEETKPGYFVFRGQSDDWMKTGKDIMGLCDTKAIEDATRLNCKDFVSNCVVVGYCKPVVLFVEPTPAFADSVENLDKLRAEVIKRMEAFQAGLFLHERFKNRVVVVEPGKLPRTLEKGNIRRNAVEEIYTNVLKDIYNKST